MLNSNIIQNGCKDKVGIFILPLMFPRMMENNQFSALNIESK